MKTKLKNPIILSSLTAISIFANSAQAALVAHYKFEETTGTALVDSSGNSNDGILKGSGDLNVSGTIGSAYKPGGGSAGNYGEIDGGVSTFGIGGNSARTISFWFNTSSFGTGNANDQYRFFGMGDGAASSFDITAENAGGGPNRIGLRYGNGNVFFDSDNSGSAFLTGTWYHVAVVYDGTTLDFEAGASDGIGLNFYVNGALMNIAGGNSNNGTQALTTSATDIALGAKYDGSVSSGGSGLYPGLLDDVQFYDEALSSAQVSSLFNNPGSVIPEPSVALLGGLGFLALLRRRR